MNEGGDAIRLRCFRVDWFASQALAALFVSHLVFVLYGVVCENGPTPFLLAQGDADHISLPLPSKPSETADQGGRQGVYCGQHHLSLQVNGSVACSLNNGIFEAFFFLIQLFIGKRILLCFDNE